MLSVGLISSSPTFRLFGPSIVMSLVPAQDQEIRQSLHFDEFWRPQPPMKAAKGNNSEIYIPYYAWQGDGINGSRLEGSGQPSYIFLSEISVEGFSSRWSLQRPNLVVLYMLYCSQRQNKFLSFTLSYFATVSQYATCFLQANFNSRSAQGST